MTERREDSGLIDLDALMKQAEREPSRRPPKPAAPATPSARVAPSDDSVKAVTAEVPPAPKLPDLERAPSLPPAPPPEAPAKQPTIPAAPMSKRSKKLALLAFGLMAVAGLAAFTLEHRAPSASVAPAAPTVAAAPPPTTTLVSEPAPVAARGFDPNALPVAVASAPANTVARAPGVVAAPPTAATPEPSVAMDDLAKVAPNTSGDLGSAMRTAVGDKEGAAVKEAETAGSAGQVRPSQGALVGALGSVLPSARACLGPDDPIRSALVVFRSDGTVKDVEIRGAKAEDACVKSALSKARVAPFADDTFATRVTVRP